jgi:hypothetical protein
VIFWIRKTQQISLEFMGNTTWMAEVVEHGGKTSTLVGGFTLIAC